MVTVTGGPFTAPEAIVCEFGSAAHRVPATWLNEGAVTCLSPAHEPALSELRLSTNGQQFVTAPAPFEFNYVSIVVSLYPSSGTRLGGTEVEVRGIGFTQSPALRCKFGEAVVDATFVDPMLVRCRAPASVEGAAEVEVSNNAVDYTADGVKFVFVSSMAVSGLSPKLGPTSGGTRLLVTGSGFNTAGEMYCGIGGEVVSARVLNSTALECETPGLSASAKLTGAAAVEVSSNGVDFTTSGLDFTYQPPVHITSVEPTFVAETGGTSVVVVGTGFDPTSARIRCRFGTVTSVPATYLTPTSVRCTAPSHAPETVLVHVANNGVDFTGDGASLEYRLRLTLASVTPSTGPVSGGTTVVIRGSQFPSTGLSCVFGTLGLVMLSREILNIWLTMYNTATPQVPSRFQRPASAIPRPRALHRQDSRPVLHLSACLQPAQQVVGI